MDISNLLKQKETQKALTMILAAGPEYPSMNYKTLLAMPTLLKMFTEEWAVVKKHNEKMEQIKNNTVDIISIENADDLNDYNYGNYEDIMNELYVNEEKGINKYLRIKVENIEDIQKGNCAKYILNNNMEVHYIIHGIICYDPFNIKKLSIIFEDKVIYQDKKPQTVKVKTNDDDIVDVILLGQYGLFPFNFRNTMNLKIDFINGPINKNIELLCSIKHIEHIYNHDILLGDTVLRYTRTDVKVITKKELRMGMEEIKQKFKERE